MLQIERCLSLRASFLPAGGRYKGAHPLGGPRYGPKNTDERYPKNRGGEPHCQGKRGTECRYFREAA